MTRREGKRAGAFDVIVIELAIDDPAGATVAVSRQSFIFFRERGGA